MPAIPRSRWQLAQRSARPAAAAIPARWCTMVKAPYRWTRWKLPFACCPGLPGRMDNRLLPDDSVYAYNLAADPTAGGSNYLVERTKSYEAAGATTVQWWGKPGYIDSTYVMNFWAPLPSHLWSQIPNDQLADSAGPSRSPIGWGPFVIKEWVAGDHITLTKNPHYFRARRRAAKSFHADLPVCH